VRCPSCSSPVADGRRFCSTCGTPLSVTVGAAARATAATSTPLSTNGGDARPGAAGGLVLPSGDTAGPTDSGLGTGLDSRAGTAFGTDVGTGVGTGEEAGSEGAASVADPTAPVAVPGTFAGAEPYPDDPARPIDARTTQVMEVDTASPAGAAAGRSGTPWRERLAPAGDAARRHARELAGRYRAAPRDVRLALVGAVLTVASFLLLPFAAGTGSAVEIGGRLWWRPLAAVVATVLLATARRAGNAAERFLAAVVIATIGATEGGLVGLVSGDADGARIGYYGMLAGLAVVLFAAVRAARERCGR
jgi:hypothetical protein